MRNYKEFIGTLINWTAVYLADRSVVNTGTTIAISDSWEGVQDQVDYQNSQNFFATSPDYEFTYELDEQRVLYYVFNRDTIMNLILAVTGWYQSYLTAPETVPWITEESPRDPDVRQRVIDACDSFFETYPDLAPH